MDYFIHWITCSNGCFILQGTTIVCTTWWVVQTMGKGRWAGAKTVCKCSSSSPKPRVSHPRPPRHPTSIVTWESSSNSRWCRISKVGHQCLNLWSEFRFLFMTTFLLLHRKMNQHKGFIHSLYIVHSMQEFSFPCCQFKDKWATADLHLIY